MHKEYGKHSEKAAHVTEFSHTFEETAEVAPSQLAHFGGVKISGKGKR